MLNSIKLGCNLPKKNLVFIDSTVENWQFLAKNVNKKAEVVILNAQENGIAQIDRQLRSHEKLDSVHIVSHGSPGCLYLGNGKFDLDNLAQYTSLIKSWSSLLTATPLLIYGCRVAAGELGRKFLQQLQFLTGASISASARPTGHRAKGGDWQLEIGAQNAIAFSQTVKENYAEILAIFTVNTLADENDGIDTGKVSLRDAIASANSSAGLDTIEFDASLSGTIKLANGELQIADDVTINGTGSDRIIVDGDSKSRVFKIDGDNNSDRIEVAIEELTITGGKTESPSDESSSGGGIFNVENLMLANSVISGNTTNNGGGGINNYGELTLIDSTVDDNTASYGGGIATTIGSLNIIDSKIEDNTATSGRGGGIFGFLASVTATNSTIRGNKANDGGGIGLSQGSVTAIDSTISDNEATSGGGVLVGQASVTMTDSKISGNTATSGNGGGIYGYSYSDITANSSTISGNRAKSGGGIYVSDAGTQSNLILNDSTIAGNKATDQGGGIRIARALYSQYDSSLLTVMNSTISGNEAGKYGGGIDTAYTKTTITNSTIAKNSANDGGGIRHFPASEAKVNVKNTIVAGNIDTNDNNNPDVSGAFTSNGFNLIGNKSGSTGFENDRVESDINKILDPNLADNGGSTLTYALVPDSPAIDAGNNNDIPDGITTDQRGEGFPRIVGGKVDIGAYEADTISPFLVTNINDSGAGSLRQAIFNANNIAGANTVTFNASLAGQTINLTSGILQITDDLTVTGLGSDRLTVRSGGFRVDDSNFDKLLEVEIEGLTITNAGIVNRENLTVKDSTISGSDSSGIDSSYARPFSSKLTVINSTISGNKDFGVKTDYGSVIVSDSTIANNDGAGIGGSFYSSVDVNNSTIYNNADGGIRGGFVRVNNSKIRNNNAGGGIGGKFVIVNNSAISGNNSRSNGGGIFGLEVTVTNSTVSGNKASRNGGGISSLGNSEYDTTVTNSTISGNTASGNGGGISARYSASFTVTGSTIDRNQATKGGGIDFSVTTGAANFNLINSTISGNEVTEDGGGIFTYSYANSPVNITNSTIIKNSANNGGGVFNTSPDESKVNIVNAIVAGNRDTLGNDNPDVSGSFTSNGFNLIGNTSDSTGLENDLVEPDINKILDPNLTDNGGPTRTHALVPNSRAINAGNNSSIPDGITTDQRGEGFPRVVGGKVDIGAYEAQTIANVIDGTDGDDTLNGTAEDDIINGFAGNDFIDGKAGNDTIDGGTGNLDRMFGGDGNDTIIDGNGVNGAHGGIGNDKIDVTFVASWDNDNNPKSSPRSDGKISGGYGNDDITVTMNKNNFFINLKGDEPKTNNPQDGNDVITLLGSYGNSVADLGGGNDTFNGGGGNDNVSGGNGGDTILGMGGSDRIAGDNGRDTLIGGTGNDMLIGGRDSDTFVLEAGAGVDTITDFTDNSDLIGLANGLSFADLTVTANGNNTSLSLTNTSELLAVLNGVNPDALSAVDYVAV